jgi:phosphatidylglycerophosphate synthase
MVEAPPQSEDRRPIAARHWRLSRRVAGWLARQGVTANAISVAGMLSGILAGVALAATSWTDGWERWLWLAGALCIQLRLLANMLDGMVAIETGTTSPVGELYNDVPDRISDMAALIGAGYSVGGDVALGYVAACVALLTAYVRAVGKAAGAPSEYCGPMAKQQRMFLLTLVAIWCGLAPASWQPAWGDSGAWGLVTAGLVVIIGGGIVTVLRRLMRSAANLRKSIP